MNYTDFAKKMILALYFESDGDTSLEVKFNSLYQKYAISVDKPFWIENLKGEWLQQGLASFPEDGSGRRETAVITIAGVRNAEATDQSILLMPSSPIDPNDVVLYPVPASASARIEERLEAEIIPASDRVVRLDHNNPEFVAIANGLARVREAVREINDSDVDPEERERVLASFDAAQTFWQAAQIKVIQLKVGVLMAVEDAVRILGKTAKAVTAALLVDSIKAFVKNHTGVDLDNF